MKTLLKPLFNFLFILFFFSGCVIDFPESVTGNGHIITNERDVPAFHGIKVSTGIDVEITQDDTEKLVLEADENLHDVIKTEVENGILKIYSVKNIRMAKSKQVYLSYKNLDMIGISSAGDVKGVNTLHTNDLKISLSSAGDLNLDVEAERIKIDISSSGNARLSGHAEYMDADLSSAGDFNAFDLEVKKGKVNVSSAGDAKVYITDEASLTSSSAGDIIYKGEPKIINVKTSSAGDVRKY
ncbi:MAG: DUF2807 domain-containing protein [Bacteroidales bacterium]|nr:DUF2807 domain-containing protein [Bacteroidales bacterium]